MNPFTQYLPPHRPLCLCIGDNAPHLGETNLALPASSREMLPLLKEVGVQYDLISLVIPQRESASIIEELFCDRTGNDLANFMSLLTTRGNLVLFTNSAELDEKIARVQQRWLELKNNHHQHGGHRYV